MNQNSTTWAEVGQSYIALANLYGHPLNELGLARAMAYFQKFEAVKVKLAMDQWGESERRFPLPSDIIRIIDPKFSSHDAGVLMASQILSSISRFGWNNPEQAKAYLGDQAWGVVKALGGWVDLCSKVTADNESIYRAQIRDYAAIDSTRHKAEEFNAATALTDQSMKDRVTNLLGSMPMN